VERLVPLPVERVVDHDGLGDRVGVVRVVPQEVVAAGVRQRTTALPLDRTFDCLRVRVDQKLLWVEAVSLLRRPAAVDAISVALSRTDAGQVAVPVVRRPLRHVDALLLVAAVEERQLDALRVLGEEREVGSFAVPDRAQRERRARPDSPQA
jgi:hypothetical protein